MFDEGEEPWGPDPPFRMPVFVVTHHPREPLVREGGTTFTFVTDGLQSAVEQAKAAAGGREVEIGGGADVIQQCLVAGLLDELVLHVVPLFPRARHPAVRPARARRRPPGAHRGHRVPLRHDPSAPRGATGGVRQAGPHLTSVMSSCIPG
jgi:hypothetical protein